MQKRGCDLEQETVRALRSGNVEASTIDHLAACASCRQLADVIRSLQTMTDVSGEMPRLPEPGHLWWRAMLLQRWEAERLATRPIDTMQHAEVVVGIIGAVILVAWQWPTVVRWFSETDSAALAAWVSLATPSAIVPLVIGGAILLAGTLLFTVRSLMAE